MSEVREHSLVVQRHARWFERGDLDARELWLLLHGYGQLARDFLEQCGALARPERLLVAPEALSRFYLRSGRGAVGATWMTREARAEEIDDYVGYLDALVATFRARRAEREVVVLGFSQGVATAWRWSLRARSAPRRLIALCGGIPPEVELDSERVRRLHITLCTGELDESHPPTSAELDERRLVAAGASCEHLRFPGGHTVEASVLAQL